MAAGTFGRAPKQLRTPPAAAQHAPRSNPRPQTGSRPAKSNASHYGAQRTSLCARVEARRPPRIPELKPTCPPGATPMAGARSGRQRCLGRKEGRYAARRMHANPLATPRQQQRALQPAAALPARPQATPQNSSAHDAGRAWPGAVTACARRKPPCRLPCRPGPQRAPAHAHMATPLPLPRPTAGSGMGEPAAAAAAAAYSAAWYCCGHIRPTRRASRCSTSWGSFR